MPKRKREGLAGSPPPKKTALESSPPFSPLTIQIIAGSYERVLHGVTATLPSTEDGTAKFEDAFLIQPHMSRITSLAVSPASDSSKRFLATGSADERINLYQISGNAPSTKSKAAKNSTKLSSTGNRELGSLLHHNAQVTNLLFDGRNKLFSAAEDNTIAITRLRDMTTLSTIKVPLPKTQNRPSGDTAAVNDLPKGVNSFAAHPSMKLMVSVGRGERCMRLWNLTTGKKAGVLDFDRSTLAQVGEGKFSKGEGVSVQWDSEGEEFVVAFERGALIFGMDARPKAKLITKEKTKLHRIQYLDVKVGEGDSEGGKKRVLAISTEDGRVLFFSTDVSSNQANGEADSEESKSESQSKDAELPDCVLLAQLGGHAAGVTVRIKDFEILESEGKLFVVTASSDGTLRVWSLDAEDLLLSTQNGSNGTMDGKSDGNGETSKPTAAAKQVGKLLGTYETENRIICMAAFVMDPPSQTTAEEDDDVVVDGEEDESSEDEDSE